MERKGEAEGNGKDGHEKKNNRKEGKDEIEEKKGHK